MGATKYRLIESKDQGYVDVNTGLFSSRFFKTIIAKQVQSFERYQAFFSIVLVTISEKAVKEVGSNLKEIASFIRENVRVVDEIGSSGNGQFCILLPHTMSQGASVVADRMRANLLDKLALPNPDELDVDILSVPEELLRIRQLADLDRSCSA
ncbi:MAG: diguanylate cyclase [Actinobacteria bacterium]|nr:diguanylate cyclase [Actinomycetota bacterium]